TLFRSKKKALKKGPCHFKLVSKFDLVLFLALLHAPSTDRHKVDFLNVYEKFPHRILRSVRSDHSQCALRQYLSDVVSRALDLSSYEEFVDELMKRPGLSHLIYLLLLHVNHQIYLPNQLS